MQERGEVPAVQPVSLLQVGIWVQGFSVWGLGCLQSTGLTFDLGPYGKVSCRQGPK